jgi:hypothetical protein
MRMTKKKLSVFLEPELVHAAKIQVARTGGRGVSDILASIVTCAHCKKPIENEWVVAVGVENSFDVFYHKDIPQCVEACKLRMELS